MRQPAPGPAPEPGPLSGAGGAAAPRAASFAARTAILVLQLLFVGALLGVWLLSERVRNSHSLWILWLYSFPSEFLVAPLPHEPIFFYFGKFYSPLVVAAVAVSSTVLTEGLNYSVFGYFADRSWFERVHRSRITRAAVRLFYRSPFWALFLVGLAPVPFYPMRFLVVLARYPLWRYCGVVLLSRFPRFFLLAWLGSAVRIPDWLLFVVFSVLILAINVPVVRAMLRDRKPAARAPGQGPEPGPAVGSGQGPEPGQEPPAGPADVGPA